MLVSSIPLLLLDSSRARVGDAFTGAHRANACFVGPLCYGIMHTKHVYVFLPVPIDFHWFPLIPIDLSGLVIPVDFNWFSQILMISIDFIDFIDFIGFIDFLLILLILLMLLILLIFWFYWFLLISYWFPLILLILLTLLLWLNFIEFHWFIDFIDALLGGAASSSGGLKTTIRRRVRDNGYGW